MTVESADEHNTVESAKEGWERIWNEVEQARESKELAELSDAEFEAHIEQIKDKVHPKAMHFAVHRFKSLPSATKRDFLDFLNRDLLGSDDLWVDFIMLLVEATGDDKEVVADMRSRIEGA